jgi:hypothetical protein
VSGRADPLAVLDRRAAHSAKEGFDLMALDLRNAHEDVSALVEAARMVVAWHGHRNGSLVDGDALLPADEQPPEISALMTALAPFGDKQP